MSNVTVSFTPANVTVDETNLTVNVSETTSNIVVSSIASVANAQLVRDQLSVTDTGGDGSLTYANTTGVFTYTGPSASEVRAHFSNTSPITLSSGVIGIDSNAVFSGKTTDDLTEGSTNLYYTTARANSAIGAYQGDINTAGTITAASFSGDGGGLSNVSTLTNAQAKAYIEANGLDATADITTTGNITALNAGGLDTHLRSNVVTGIPTSEGGGDKLKLTSGGTGDEFILLDQPNNKIELDTSGNIDYKARENNFTGNLTIYPYPGDTGGNIIFANNISGIYGGPNGAGGYSDVLFGSGITIQGDGGSGNDLTIDDGEVILTSGNVLVGNVNSSTDGSVRVSNRVTAKGIYSNTLVDTNHLQLKSTYAGSNVSLGHGDVALISNYSSAGNKDMVIMNSQYFPTGNYGYGNIWLTRGDFANYSIKIEPGVTNVQGDLSVTANPNDSSTGNVSGVTLRSTGALGLVVSGNATIGGNLDVTGNINSETVVDLFVEDRNITMQYGAVGSPSANSQIFVDRGSEANSYVKWDEGGDAWKFSNDGSTEYPIPTSTSDLAEGTNLYYTNARANAAFVDSLDNITTAISSNSNITTTANISGANVIADNIYATGNDSKLQIGDSAGSGDRSELNIDGNGNMTFSTFVSGDADAGQVDIGAKFNTSASNVTLYNLGDAGNVESASFAIFRNDGDNFGNIDIRSGLRLNQSGFANVSHTNILRTTEFIGDITTDGISMGAGHQANFEGQVNITNSGDLTLGNASNIVLGTNGEITIQSSGKLNVDKIESGASANLNLKGQANGIHLDTTIDSTESRILDIDTDGYRITSADAGSANIASYTGGVKGMLIAGTVTAGSPTMTTFPIQFAIPTYPAGVGIAGQSGSVIYADFTGGTQTIQAAFADASAFGGVQNGEGWILFNAAGGGFLTNFDRDTHVSSISGNTLTLNKNAIASATTIFIMFPAVASSTQDGLSFLCDYTVGSYNFEGLQPYTQNYVLPETLSNVTIDRTSVSDDFDLANVKLGHIADLNVGDNDYVRVDRGLLIGSKAEPDPFSSRNSQSSPSGASMLGLTLEHDGETEYAANNTPQVKFLINNYTANSILDMATTPSWAADFGSTNVTVDNQYLSAPTFNFKTLNSSKEAANGRVLANTVVGSIVWNAVSNATALDVVGTEIGLNTGSDLIHPPAGIKVRMASDQAQTSNTTAMDMYVQSSYRTSYRDGTTDAKGSIPRTFLANKEGNTVIAAKTDGKVTLRPVRDYGDSGNDASFTENRYAHELHEYHEFLGAGFLGSKAGTLVEIQPKSGETGGSANFNYDSKGDATLRLSTHEANNTVKKQWDITTEQSSGNLYIRDHTNSTNVMHFDGSRVFIDESLRLQNLTTTEINAIASPQAGDVVYNTTLNQICFYNGTAWQKVTSATM